MTTLLQKNIRTPSRWNLACPDPTIIVGLIKVTWRSEGSCSTNMVIPDTTRVVAALPVKELLLLNSSPVFNLKDLLLTLRKTHRTLTYRMIVIRYGKKKKTCSIELVAIPALLLMTRRFFPLVKFSASTSIQTKRSSHPVTISKFRFSRVLTT